MTMMMWVAFNVDNHQTWRPPDGRRPPPEPYRPGDRLLMMIIILVRMVLMILVMVMIVSSEKVGSWVPGPNLSFSSLLRNFCNVYISHFSSKLLQSETQGNLSECRRRDYHHRHHHFVSLISNLPWTLFYWSWFWKTSQELRNCPF